MYYFIHFLCAVVICVFVALFYGYSVPASADDIKSAIKECPAVRLDIKRELDSGNSISGFELGDMLSICKDVYSVDVTVEKQRKAL